MIPRANITAWRRTAPWPDDANVEQDLILSRALVEIFRRPTVTARAAFRGGTALHKLYLEPPGRYSEDIDLVQRDAGAIGSLVNEIREALDPWLGTPRWKTGRGRFTLAYHFETTFSPVVRRRVKIEINTREHFAVQGLLARPYTVENDWFSGTAEVATYALAELLGTKLRALYQRKKGRDLFDLWLGLGRPEVDAAEVLAAFERYMGFVEASATRAQFEANMAAKMTDATFRGDIATLLRAGLDYDPESAWSRVHTTLVAKLPGDPWKSQVEST